jgi:hypothetical protein
MPSESARIAREKRTIRAMIGIYCRARHGRSEAVCRECTELLDYATGRLDRCPFGAGKTACVDCEIHCYKPAMRDRVRQVMRYAGPRMLWKHPVLALLHVIDGRRKTTCGQD